MPRPQTLGEEAVADAQVLAAVPGVQVDELRRLPGEQTFGAADEAGVRRALQNPSTHRRFRAVPAAARCRLGWRSA
jgi:hypothetical protein